MTILRNTDTEPYDKTVVKAKSKRARPSDWPLDMTCNGDDCESQDVTVRVRIDINEPSQNDGCIDVSWEQADIGSIYCNDCGHDTVVDEEGNTY